MSWLTEVLKKDIFVFNIELDSELDSLVYFKAERMSILVLDALFVPCMPFPMMMVIWKF